ncbi:MAG: hypothetical protein K6F05_02220, partial [Succinivibrio sp.]|nr:hypothetical protein [Succinivibrio sp.]
TEPTNWDVCAVSAVPAAIYSESLNLDVIGIANDESVSNDILVRADSKIIDEHDWNMDFPDAKGSPDTIRDKTYFIRKDTSSFYTFLCWLEIFGLTLNEVNYVDALPSDAVNKLYENKGEGAAMWSPHSFDAQRLGYVEVANAEQVGAYVPMIFIADREFATHNKPLIAKFLAMYLRAVEVQKNDLESLVKPYQDFLRKYSGKKYDAEFCRYDLQKHPVYSIDRQLAAFTNRGNRPSAMEKLKRKLLNKFTLISLDLGEPKNYMANSYDLNPTDAYLKEAKRFIAN